MMDNVFKHNGYLGSIEYDDRDKGVLPTNVPFGANRLNWYEIVC